MRPWMPIATAAVIASACSRQHPVAPAPAPTEPPKADWDQPVPPLLPGMWTDGATTLKLDNDHGYWWQQPRTCAKPPCPLVATTGTYEERGEELAFVPDDDGATIVVPFRFDSDGYLELTLSPRATLVLRRP